MLARLAAFSGVLLGLSLTTIRPHSTADAGSRASQDDGLHFTMIGQRKVTGTELKGAVDGVDLVFLLRGVGIPFPPAFGEVRLVFDGLNYNQVTNPSSSKPLAPDLIIHDGARFARQHPGLFEKRGAPPKHSLVLEYVIRGDRPLPAGSGTVSLEFGMRTPAPDGGPDKIRWVWYDYPYPGAD